MAAFQDSSRGPFQASSLAKWFHSAPHKDLQLEDTTTIFSPAEKSYREVRWPLFKRMDEHGRRQIYHSFVFL